jgi:50S ribosomal protein L16 3-hydroxylase
MFFNQPNLTAERFLRNYWQKRPLLLPQAFPDFKPELEADDIAGLACDEMAESRLVTGCFEDRNWTLRYGPFSEADFAALPERDWTLLVQDVEKHYPPLRALISRFGFLPRWRIDDLMVSVAGPGGSVGPHVDQYDVFLLQAAGSRRWDIAETFDPEVLPDCDLNVLRSFVPEQSWTLVAGDMLYLPPGVAHHGIAAGLEDRGPRSIDASAPCMTWSIGMRAPSAADLLQALGEWLAESQAEGGRYRDPDPGVAARAGQIDRRARDRLRDLARSAIDDEDGFSAFLGAFLSRYRLAHEPAPPARPIGPAQLRDALQRGAVLHHNPWTRLAWIETGDSGSLFAAGTPYPCGAELATALCDPDRLPQTPARQFSDRLELICELINRGHLVLEAL